MAKLTERVGIASGNISDDDLIHIVHDAGGTPTSYKMTVGQLKTFISAITGSGADNQIAVYNGTDTIEGDTSLTWDGNTVTVTGDASNKAQLTLDSDSTQNAVITLNHNSSGGLGSENSLVVFKRDDITKYMVGLNGVDGITTDEMFVIANGDSFDDNGQLVMNPNGAVGIGLGANGDPSTNHLELGGASVDKASLRIAPQFASPTSPESGQLRNDSGAPMWYNGSAWVDLASGGGSSEWADNGDGGISFDGTASGTKRYIEINDGTAFNPSGNITQGMIVVGDLHTSTNLIRRGMIFGYANQMATTGTATGEVIFGNTCTTEGGQYNIITGYLNTMKSGKNYSAIFGSQNTNNGTNSFIAGNLNTVNNDSQAIIGWNNKTQSGVANQIAIGSGMQITSNHGNAGIFFGQGSARPNISMVNADSVNAMNMAMGSFNSGRTTDGAGLTGSGGGVFYWMNAQTVPPTVNLANAVGAYAQDRIAGDCGLVLKSENGTKHMFAGSVGINTTTPDANCAIDIEGVAKVKSYTVATVPTAVVGGIIYVSDETGGATLAFSDGANWRRTTDLAIVS